MPILLEQLQLAFQAIQKISAVRESGHDGGIETAPVCQKIVEGARQKERLS